MAWGQRCAKRELSGLARRVRADRERESGDSGGGQKEKQEGPRLLAAVGRQAAEAPFHTFSFCCPSSMAGLRF